jgi:L-amino acid N-acyltransferase YncA
MLMTRAIADWTDVWLQSCHVRDVRPSDQRGLLRFLETVWSESRRLRSLSGSGDLPAVAAWAAAADGDEHIGVVALDASGTMIGHASACRIYGSRAEVAVEIDAAHRHLGLATTLVAELARRAERHGISTFVAEVPPESRDMLDVFHDRCEPGERPAVGEGDIEFPTSGWRLVAQRLIRAADRS